MITMRYRFFIIAVWSLLLLSCPDANKSPNIIIEELINDLQGRSKRENQWGNLVANIPNNIGNTFTGNPKTTRTITWQSTIDSGEVIIGNHRYPAVSVMIDDYYFHRVDISGLESGKTYWFIAGALDWYSPKYSFTTESSSFPDGFSVLHITDPQIGTSDKNPTDAEVWKQVIETAIKQCPGAAFVANTGDVVNNTRENRIPYYFDYAQEILAKYAFVYSLGNNDSLDWYDSYFHITDNRNDDYSGILYSFDYGNTHFVSINVDFRGTDDDDESRFDLSAEQLDWLEKDLKNSSGKWKVAMTHKPDYGRNSRRNANTDVTKLFDKYNVDLVLAGHYHFYMRSKPIDTEGSDKINGTVWSIPNVAGTKFNGESGRSYLAVDEQPELPMFSELNFTATNIYLSSYTVDSDGNAVLFDTYTF